MCAFQKGNLSVWECQLSDIEKASAVEDSGFQIECPTPHCLLS